ncbi:hypothetical protein LTR36_007911 [Oleoguttula mirabilis]|uniref:Uncharacterized protein n=1 Tax=Oleoguttula mirabilis TaxID=1507867 RepID=A0AAV9J998_9PEZI|nr:hypothetical protein LTR36_007911 [Oleoguttula mirabilis]
MPISMFPTTGMLAIRLAAARGTSPSTLARTFGSHPLPARPTPYDTSAARQFIQSRPGYRAPTITSQPRTLTANSSARCGDAANTRLRTGSSLSTPSGSKIDQTQAGNFKQPRADNSKLSHAKIRELSDLEMFNLLERYRDREALDFLLVLKTTLSTLTVASILAWILVKIIDFKGSSDMPMSASEESSDKSIEVWTAEDAASFWCRSNALADVREQETRVSTRLNTPELTMGYTSTEDAAKDPNIPKAGVKFFIVLGAHVSEAQAEGKRVQIADAVYTAILRTDKDILCITCTFRVPGRENWLAQVYDASSSAPVDVVSITHRFRDDDGPLDKSAGLRTTTTTTPHTTPAVPRGTQICSPSEDAERAVKSATSATDADGAAEESPKPSPGMYRFQVVLGPHITEAAGELKRLAICHAVYAHLLALGIDESTQGSKQDCEKFYGLECIEAEPNGLFGRLMRGVTLSIGNHKDVLPGPVIDLLRADEDVFGVICGHHVPGVGSVHTTCYPGACRPP